MICDVMFDMNRKQFEGNAPRKMESLLILKTSFQSVSNGFLLHLELKEHVLGWVE